MEKIVSCCFPVLTVLSNLPFQEGESTVQPTTEIICPGQLELRVVILQADGTKILEDSNSTIVALYSTGASVTNILLSCRKSLRWTPTGGWECWADHKRTMPYENVRVHVLRVL